MASIDLLVKTPERVLRWCLRNEEVLFESESAGIGAAVAISNGLLAIRDADLVILHRLSKEMASRGRLQVHEVRSTSRR